MANNNDKWPLRHLSVRVPWHDDGWRGTVCKAPSHNMDCLRLNRIAEQRDDGAENSVHGRRISELEPKDWPACIAERATFMADFEFTTQKVHPYSESSPKTHGHFSPTPLRHPPYSVAAVPFSWMLQDNMGRYSSEYGLSIRSEYEPKLSFKSSWIQDRRNQSSLLDCFFGHIRPQESLCFFYAKQVPFVEDSRRVLVGVGRVKKVAQDCVEYEYKSSGELRSVLWERMVQHTIRPDFKDGFLLPYHAAMDLEKEDPEFDPAMLAAFAPTEHFDEFSYASEHVTHDAAIAALLSCAASLQVAKSRLPGPWDQCLNWIDARVAELWTMRGPCPGLGAALCAFGIECGTLVARRLETLLADNEDPWPFVDKMFKDPKKVLPPELARNIDPTLSKTWHSLGDERRTLLKLLSRFSLTPNQAVKIYVSEERGPHQFSCTDAEFINNPYLLYEATRLTEDPIGVRTIDMGAFPEPVVREMHPLPKPSALEGALDPRRIQAFAIAQLENSASVGHTLLPRANVIQGIRKMEVRPACLVTQDTLGALEEQFHAEIEVVKIEGDEPGYQLRRLLAAGELIRREFLQRIEGKRHGVVAKWRQLLDQNLPPIGKDDIETEDRARVEKAVALAEMAESRACVVIGPAGSGKTTLLKTFCAHPAIRDGGLLLLAPTGKARVRLEQATGQRAQTLAQFLSQSGRYEGATGRYLVSDWPKVEAGRTVIVDEASMLTEEMLAALIDSVKGVHRLILVGDPRQLPPIGAGRPFVDIVARLRPDGVEQRFPKVGTAYAELTIIRRQEGQLRQDLQLASWFSGLPTEPGEDDVFDALARGEEFESIRCKSWSSPENLKSILFEILTKELGLESKKDSRGVDLSLGATESGERLYFNKGAAEKAEDWQILSPVRGMPHGVAELNRTVHKELRGHWLAEAGKKWPWITAPMGPEQIVYGDKIINTRNRSRSPRRVYPQNGINYIANGEIGIVEGQTRGGKITHPWLLKVEFSSQLGFQYDFNRKEFGEDAEISLELAYALTVHKAQGSGFKLVILILPDPCRLLSRELLYTALTRQEDKIVILYQGDIHGLKKYADSYLSETAARLTNLFVRPNMIHVRDKFLEDHLINVTSDGTLVRSKSEVIIYERLLANGLTPTYERPLTLGGFTKYPDFTIEDDRSGEIFFWEHCGMLFDPAYRKRWEAKRRWYHENGISEKGGGNGTLVVTEDNEKGGISAQQIETIIKKQIIRG